MGWETSNEEGLRGAYDPAVRDPELDADGVSADVLFADADAITGMGSPPFGAGLAAGEIEDPGSGLRRGPSAQPLPGRAVLDEPQRRAGIALVPLCHDPSRAVKEAEWAAAQPGIRGVMIPTMWREQPPYSSEVYEPVLGGVRRRPPARAHPLRRGTARGLQRPPRHLPGRGGVVGGATVVAPALLGCLRTPPGAHVRGDRGRRLLDRRLQVEVGPVHGWGSHDQEDGRPARREDLQAALGVLRHESLRRRFDHVEGGDPPPPRPRHSTP